MQIIYAGRVLRDQNLRLRTALAQVQAQTLCLHFPLAATFSQIASLKLTCNLARDKPA